jgi:GTP cyclohydrolase IA
MFYSNQNKNFSEEEKNQVIDNAEQAYRLFMEALKIDLNDPNAKDTPKRVAKMYVNELFKGRYCSKPDVQSFPNTEGYDEIIFTNCNTFSVCAHHHVLINNQIFIGVLSNPDPSSKLIGLSKFTRIAEWISARPTIQEDMTSQLHDEINSLCGGNLGVIVYIVGQHGCTISRGVKQLNSKMITCKCSGAFKSDKSSKDEFLSMVKSIEGKN